MGIRNINTFTQLINSWNDDLARYVETIMKNYKDMMLRNTERKDNEIINNPIRYEDEYYFNGEKMFSKIAIEEFEKNYAVKNFKYNIDDIVVVMNNGLPCTCTVIGRRKYIDTYNEYRNLHTITINKFEEKIKYVLDIMWSIGKNLVINEEDIIMRSEDRPIKVVYENDMNLLECNPSVKLDIKPFNMSGWNSFNKPPETFTVKDCSVEFTAEDPYISKRLRELTGITKEISKERNDNNMRTIYNAGDIIEYKSRGKNAIAIILEAVVRNNNSYGSVYRIMNIEKIRIDRKLIPVYPIYENTYWIKENDIVGRINGAFYFDISLLIKPTMPNITDYTYNPDTATTIITWSDNTTTKVTAESLDEADQYTGFMTAYAKKAAGNSSRIQSIYERALKLPEKKALTEQKAKEQEEEQRKIRENQKARKRRQRIRREARRRKEQYEKTLIMDEAKKLAEKEYGVPYEQSDWLKQNEGNTGNDKT